MFTTLHCCNIIVYLQHGSGNYCQENDVIDTLCLAMDSRNEYPAQQNNGNYEKGPMPIWREFTRTQANLMFKALEYASFH